MAELGGKQLSTLLESLPGIASVLRSPVADAIANVIRAAAGQGEFHENDVRELLQYATRRGLMGNDEADQIVDEVKNLWKKATKRGRPKPAKRPAPTPEVRIPVEQVKGVKPAAAARKPAPKARGDAAGKAAAGKAARSKAPAARSGARKTPAATTASKRSGEKKSAAKKAVRKTASKPKTAKKTAARKSAKPPARKSRRK